MNEKSRIPEYILELENDPHNSQINIIPLIYNDYVHCIEIRFPATVYGTRISNQNFTDMTSVLLRRTSGTVVVSSTMELFQQGILSLKIAFMNHGYKEKKVMKALDLLVSEILPSFKHL